MKKFCNDLMEYKNQYYCRKNGECKYQLKVSANRKFCEITYQLEIRKGELEKKMEKER